MQNYRGNVNDYTRRGNYGRGGRNNCGGGPVSTPYPLSGMPECMSGGRSAQPYKETPSCCMRDDVMEEMPLAMAYVPWQNWRCIYEPEKAFARGTIFEELDKPFYGRGGCNQ